MMKSVFAFLVASLLLASCATHDQNLPDDGSSMKRAIYVATAAEEADILKKWCRDCELVKRNIIQGENRQQYEKVLMKEPNGEKRWYWFDVSALFGNH